MRAELTKAIYSKRVYFVTILPFIFSFHIRGNNNDFLVVRSELRPMISYDIAAYKYMYIYDCSDED